MQGTFTTLGITGGIGSGKSALAELLREMGVPVFDADACVRMLLDANMATHKALLVRWGEAAFTEQGEIDRAWIAQKIFADVGERLFLESILHPRVREYCLEEMAQARGRGDALFVAEIPLLFENGFDAMFEHTVCLWVSPAVQRARLMAERGMSADQITARAAAQWPIEKKAAAADFVLLNDGSKEFLKDQLRVLHRRLTSL